MSSKVKCAWCNEMVPTVVTVLEKDNGKVKERRCKQCGKVLAAYLYGEGDFIKSIRKFENTMATN